MAILVTFSLLAGLGGWAVASIPAPDDVSTFWIGNFSSPWAVLAFGAGWAQRGRLWAVVTAVVAEIACVAGFYSRLLFLDPAHLGLSPATAPLESFSVGLSGWLVFVGPWMLLGVGAGVVYGLLGASWARSRTLLAAVTLGLPFLVEPLAWPIYVGFVKGPAIIWIAEVGVGATIIALAFRSRRSTSNASSPTAAR